MTFVCGLLIGLILPKCVQYAREHPEVLRGGFHAMKRAFGR